MKTIRILLYYKVLKIPILLIYLTFFLTSYLGLAIYQDLVHPGNSDFKLDLILPNKTGQLAPSSTTPVTNIKVSTTTQSFTPTASPMKSGFIPKISGRSVNIPILTYHYISNNPNPKDVVRDNLSVSPDKFDKEMNDLAKKGYTPITLDTMYAGLKGVSQLPSKPIILTFDDGYTDFYSNAFPILRKYNFHAVSFIPTGLMNQGYYLTWDQIKEMDSSGLISFQAHSVTHPNLTFLSNIELNRQIIESKKRLEQELNKPVNFFAYPYGASDDRVWQAVKQAGFVGAVGTWGGTIESEGNIYDMPRIKISGDLSLSAFYSQF